MTGTGASAPPLNLKQVARHLGVHYMTAYRYVRQGRLPAQLVDGGWTVDPDDLAAFEQGRSGAHAVASDRTRPTRRADRTARLRDRLRAGDETGAWREVESALVAGRGPDEVLCELLPRALDRRDHPADGEAATENDLAELALDHVAAATATRLVDRLGARFTRPGRSRGG